MSPTGPDLGFLRPLTWGHVFLIAAVLIGSRLVVLFVRWAVRCAAEGAPSHRRLVILRVAPIARLLVGLASIAIIVPVLVEPSFENVVALAAAASLVLAFALKDYVSCLAAGAVTIIENAYQPGDWIELDGVYGEVKLIGSRAVHIVTADDNKVIIPHARLWTTGVVNASSGKRSLLCVTNFYLHADHDGAAVQRALMEIGEASVYRKPGAPVTVSATETPWGTHYKLKVYVGESREQFAMTTDLTIRGKERLRAMAVTFAQAPFTQAPFAGAPIRSE